MINYKSHVIVDNKIKNSNKSSISDIIPIQKKKD